MLKPSDGAKKLIGDFSPKLVELTSRVRLSSGEQYGFESLAVKKPDLACVGYPHFCVAPRCGSVHGSDDTTDVRAQDRPLGVFEDKNGDPSPR